MNIWRFCVNNALALAIAGLAVAAHAQQKEISAQALNAYSRSQTTDSEWEICHARLVLSVGSCCAADGFSSVWTGSNTT